jgi:hypothetical protein
LVFFQNISVNYIAAVVDLRSRRTRVSSGHRQHNGNHATPPLRPGGPRCVSGNRLRQCHNFPCEGIPKAKAEGRYKGRAPTARAKAADVIKMAEAGATKENVAEALGIGIASVYRMLSEAKAKTA